MENNFDDKLSQKFREELENYPVSYEQGAWEQFNRDYLHKPPVRSIALWQRYAMRIAAAVLIAAVGLCAVYYWRNQSPMVATEIGSAQTTPPESQPLTIEKPAAVSIAPDESVQTDAVITQKTVSALRNSPPIAGGQKKASVVSAPVTPTHQLTQTNSNTQYLLPSEKQSADPVVVTAAPVVLTEVDRLPLTLTDSFSWQFPALVTAQIPVHDLATTQSGTVMKVQPGIITLLGIAGGKGVKNTAMFYGAGAGVDLFLQKKLAFTTGIQLTQTNYETSSQSFRVFNNLRRDSVNATTGASQFVPVFADETQYTRIRLNLIQIPLTIKYLIGKHFFLNVGGVSYVATNNTQVTRIAQHSFLGRVQNPVQTVENNIQPFRTVYLGGGVRAPLKKATLQIEPHVSLPLSDILQDVHNTSLQWVGLNVGIYYGQ